ncbi:MAG: C-terminal binding protein [Planctomycetota bacterium]|nr:C-terminal binding protein [Planctomycetota bacterium]
MASSRFQIFISDFIADSLEIEREILGDIADVTALDAHSEIELVGRIEHADAIMLYHNLAISRSTIAHLKQCRLIVRCGVGFDNVDHAYARSRGIDVANVPDYGTEEVADSAIGMMLALTRGINFYNVRMRDTPHPWMYSTAGKLFRLRGRTFGILGLGRIGSATAIRAKALGMNVIFYDPYKQDGYDKALGIRRVESLDELLESSFVLSMHCPNTPETKHIINAKSIQKMPTGSYLINTARGAVVDVTALPDAIASGKLAGAAIDVLVDEPPAPDNPLLAAWRDPSHPAYTRLIINPHSAFYSEEGLADMRIKGSQACRNALLGAPLRNIINR